MNIIMRLLFIVFLIFINLLTTDLFAQGESNVWYFGKGDGLDFNYNPPAQLTNGNTALLTATGEGVGAISDANGNLLFYTNGNVIYDKTHTAMPNGTGLNGDGNTVQTGVIVPVNGSTTQYYLITTGSGGGKPVKWVTVDMTLNGGLGDVVIASKAGTNGTTLVASAGEGGVAIPEYTAANVPTGNYWIINHITAGADYYVSKATSAGISLVSTQTVGFVNPGQGVQMYKTNSCFDKIGVALYNSDRVEILPFDNVTGIISAPSLVLTGTGGAPFLNPEVYGIEFSPSGQFLYVTESGLNSRKTVYQFDISAGTGTNPAAVLASKSYYTAGGEVTRFGALQLGPDARIYFPGYNQSGTDGYINVIPTPDVAWSKPTPALGTDLLYQNYTYVAQMGEGLPPVLKNLLTEVRIFYNNACEGNSTNFSYIFGGKAVSQTWDFGDPSSGSNSSSSATPSHIYATAGTYTATLTIIDNCGRTRTGTVSVIVKSGPTYTLPATLCPNTNIVITGTGTNKANYTWSLSSTGSPVLATGATYTYNGALPTTVYVQDPTPLATYTTGNTTASQDFASDIGDTRFELFTTVKLVSFQGIGKTASTATLTLYKWNGTAWIAATGSEAWSQSYTVANGVTYTYSPGVTLSSGKYRLFSTNDESFYKNNGSTDGGRDVNGVVNVYGDSDGGIKGGPYINLVFAIPDPCGIRAIPIANNCCVPPTITTHPSSITRCAGVAASFTVATSAATPTYQWQVSIDNGSTWTDISGATSATYTIAAGSVTTSLNNYQYRAVVTASSCFANSNAATLTVNPIPSVSNSPLTATVCENTSWAGLTITSTVAGSTYAWTSTASAGITGNTASGTGNLPSQTFANSGTTAGTVTYAITPTANSCAGSPINYVVTVNPVPVITNNPLTTTVCENTLWAGLTITSDVAGATFAWTSTASSGAITGNTASGTGNLPSQTFANSGTTAGTVTYAITPTAGTCAGTVANYVVTVNPVPVVTNSPLTAVICEGSTWSGVTLTGDVTGTTFAWTSSASVGITGNTASGTGNLPSQTFANSGTTAGTVTYAITPTAGTCPGAVSNFVVTVNPAPVVTNSPLTASVCKGTLWAGVILTGDVTGTTFAWTSSASAGIGGNTANGTGNLPSQTFTNSGTTSGTVTYTITPTAGTCSGAVSNYVVTVNPIPTITNSPLSTSICSGSAWAGLTLTADVTGTTYAWTSSASAGITGNTTSGTGDLPSQTFTNSGTSAGTVTYVITPSANSCPGTPVNYVVTVNPATIITVQPTVSTDICVGAALNLSVTATGTSLTYQWKLGGSSIAGATSASYSVVSVGLADAGTYTVTVTGTCGAVTSNNAVVNVNGVVITTQPANQGPCVGGSATFSVTASGPGLTYQWQENTGSGFSNIGAAISSYTIPVVAAGMNGYTYQVIIQSNGLCPLTSNIATLTVNTNTTINTQPASAGLCLGDAMTLTVNASGSGVMTYQWRKGGVIIAGATSDTYTIASVASTDAGSYTVDVSSDCGPATSNAAIITINNVSITSDPANSIICQGDNTSFSVTANGLGTLSYQWQLDTGTGIFNNIAGATSSTLNLTSVGVASNGYKYRVVVKDDNLCSENSAAATLTVNPTTAITTQPSGKTLCVGNALNLSIVATGAGVLGYQWNLNGAAIGSATSSAYNVGSVTSANGGTYTVDITAGCGNLTSSAVSVTVNGVSITADPASAIICEGNDHTFDVTATGLGVLTYQWQTDNGTGTFVDIAGATSLSYTVVSPTQSISGYKYRVVVKDDNLCPSTSAIATLTVNPSTAITNPPVGANLCVGDPLSLDVTATGTGSLSYQWNLNGSPILGATSFSYSVGSVASTDAGSYTVDVTGNCTITSTSATVTVNGVTINTNPADQTICEGSNHTFSVAATGLGTLSYQWQTDNGTGTFSDIAGETSSTLALTSISYTQNGYKYRVIIKDNNLCPTTSASATLTVNPITTITSDPVGVNLCLGDPLNLSVFASGTGVLAYQWNLGGASIGGATNSTYDVASVTGANAGSYTVTVTGSCGAPVISNVAAVAVNGVTITSNPATTTACEGSNATFSVTASGLTSISYQWQTDNGTGIFSDISGAISSSLTLNSVSLSQNNYQYQVVMKDNNSCTITSSIGTLVIKTATVINTQPVGSTICQGDPLNLSVATTGTNTLTYQWKLNGSDIAGATNSTYSIGSVALANAGLYSVVVTSGSAVCSDVTSNNANIQVTAAPLSNLVVTSSDVCQGANATVTIANSESGMAYEAYIGTSMVSSGTGNGGNLNLTVNSTSLTAGTNTITINAIGCKTVTLSNTATVVMLATPGALTGSVSVCSNATSGLVYSISPVAGATTYTWTADNGAIINSGQGSTSMNVNLGASPTTITVIPHAASGKTCLASSLVVNQIISYTGLDNLTVNEDTVCVGNTITATINNISAQSYTWSLLTGASIANPNATVSTISFTAAGNYTISVQPVHQCNPVIAPITVNVVILQAPVASAGSDMDLEKFSTITLDGSGSSQGSLYTYQWTSTSGGITNPNSITATADPGSAINVYVLTVSTVNTASCSAQDEVTVKVEFKVKVPNVFSPNGDGSHDYLLIKNIEFFPKAALYIYNQWGELIYKSIGQYTVPWDGTRNGTPVPVSAYYYVLELNEKGYESLAGDITIIR